MFGSPVPGGGFFGGNPVVPPEESFIWAEGGQRMTPEEIERRRAMAEQQMATGMDFSPVGHWSQGLARVATGLAGGLQNKRIGKAEDANAAESSSVLQALLAGGGDPQAGRSAVLAALANPNISDDVKQIAGMEYGRMNPEPGSPHYWETNDGSLGIVDPLTGAPTILYQDPTPKISWVTAENPDGTKTLIPVGPNGPIMGGGDPASGAAPGAEPPAMLPPDFDFDAEGGAGASGVGPGFLDGF